MSSGSVSLAGLGSGLDISSLIDSLVSIEKIQQKSLQKKVNTHQSIVSVYQSLNTKFASVKSAAESLNIPLEWKLNTATSSDTSVSATASSDAISGSLSFIVKNLAQAQVSTSFGTVANTDAVIGTGSLLIGQTGSIGLKNLTGSGLTTGAHTLEVTQASAGASISGSAVADSITFTGSETLTVDIDGSPATLTMTAGTYNQQALAKMLTTISNGALSVSVNADKSLKLTTTHEGSVASLQITGGTALGSLGLSAGGPTNGTDGIIKVDGVSNTVTDIMPNGSNSVVLNSSAGTITSTFQGGLRLGTSTIQNVDLGDGKLSTVVNNINASNSGVKAAAVMVGVNQYRLQLQSSTTGIAGAIGTDFNAFSGVLGSLDTITAAQDATLQVGTGSTSYDIASSSNNVNGALPGVTLSLASADPNKTVTINVSGDASGLADKIQTMVNSVNDALSFIKGNSSYNASTKSGGLLLSNATSSRLQQQLMSAMTDIVSGTSLNGMGSVGLTVSQDGTISFDKAKFTTAYQANPNDVVSLFVEGGLNGTPSGNYPGIIERVLSVATSAVDSVSGAITTAIKGENSTIDVLNKQIEMWDLRLEKYRSNLQRQFTSMDIAVSQYKNMSVWLSGQINGLISGYSG